MPSPINNDFSLAHPRTQEYLDWLQPPAFDLQELWGPGIAQRAQEFSATPPGYYGANDPLLDSRFVVTDEQEAEFYRRVYAGANFMVGASYHHSSYEVAICSGPDLSEIEYRRAAYGLPGLCRRPKLPREPVEALPLPG